MEMSSVVKPIAKVGSSLKLVDDLPFVSMLFAGLVLVQLVPNAVLESLRRFVNQIALDGARLLRVLHRNIVMVELVKPVSVRLASSNVISPVFRNVVQIVLVGIRHGRVDVGMNVSVLSVE